MAKDTVTLALTGEVTLTDLSSAIGGLARLMGELSSEVSPTGNIEWVIEGLEAGSAIATARGLPGIGTGREAVEETVRLYEEVGRSARDGTIIRHPAKIREAVKMIFGVIGERVKSVRFETEDADSEVSSPASADSPASESTLHRQPLPESAHGAVRGRIQSISNRGQLRFTLYDLVDDRAVSCYLDEGHEGIMRNAWGKLAIVEGEVRRDPKTGRATTVRHTKVKVIPEGKVGSYRDAVGCAPPPPGSVLPEVTIRKGRDG